MPLGTRRSSALGAASPVTASGSKEIIACASFRILARYGLRKSLEGSEASLSSEISHDQNFSNIDAIKLLIDSGQIKGGTAHGFAPGGTALAFLVPGPYNFRTTRW
jgi:hypothetical protein